LKPQLLALLFLIFSGGFYCHAQEDVWVRWETSPELENSDWIIFTDGSLAAEYLDSILANFQNRGYLQVKKSTLSVAGDSTSVRFNLGEEYTWSKIELKGVPDEIRNNLNPVPKDYPGVNSYLIALVAAAENLGYPFAQAKLDSLNQSGSSLSGRIVFDSGPLILWDSLAISGESKTSQAYLQAESRIRPGTPFSQKEFLEASRILNRSPYFSLGGEPELTFQIKSAKPIFSIRDRNVNVLDGIIGFLPNENEPGKMLITGQVDLELYHLGGKGRDVAVHWQRLNLLSQSLEISAKESYLFRSPLSVSIGFNLLKQDTTFLNRFLSLDFGYRLGRDSHVRFFTKRQSGDLLSTSGLGELTELPEAADFRWNSYGLGANVDRRDSPFFPRRGIRFDGELAVGNKRIIQNTGIPEEVYRNVDLNSPQYLLEGMVERHFYFKPTWGMWLRGSGGMVRNGSLLLNDLFRLGGLRTIRGFNENFFFARSYSYLNMEQRLFFGGNSFLMVFTDFGILENPYFAPRIDQLLSFGAGVNLETESGIFKFVYGVGKSNLQPLQLSYSRIHFGYVARF